MTQIELIPIDESGNPARPLRPLADLVRTNCEGTASFYQTVGFVPPWIGYLSVLDGQVVGGGGFKGPPRDNSVEIAYYTLPEFEGRAIATSTARELIRMARANVPGVLVIAQTLPEPNASNALLKKLGFALAGIVVHPEDGKVWEWHLNARTAPPADEPPPARPAR
jgi:ribosomal-protein-alanine N-acetyltransferase